jgi:hypothetical protein
MKTFKIVFMKRPDVIKLNKGGVLEMAEKTITTNTDTLIVSPLAGYSVISVTEILPLEHQTNNKPKNNGN